MNFWGLKVRHLAHIAPIAPTPPFADTKRRPEPSGAVAFIPLIKVAMTAADSLSVKILFQAFEKTREIVAMKIFVTVENNHSEDFDGYRELNTELNIDEMNTTSSIDK